MNVIVSPAATVNQGAAGTAADVTADNPATLLLSGDNPFGDLLAIQLGQNADAIVLKTPAGAVGTAFGGTEKAAPDKDKKTLEAAEFAIQFQLPVGTQPLDHVVPVAQAIAVQSTEVQPATIMPEMIPSAAMSTAAVQSATAQILATQSGVVAMEAQTTMREAALRKFGEPILPQRQVIAADNTKFAVSGSTESDTGVAKAIPSAESAAAKFLPNANFVTAFTQSLPVEGVSQTAAALPTATIAASVSSSAWNSGLGEKVVWMVNQQHQGIELHLNPPSLGPLEVRISMNDGQANLSFMSHHLLVREAIESATPRLREMLGESGISLGGVSVNNGSFAQQQSAAYPGGNNRPPPINWQANNDHDLFAATSTVAVRHLHANGMVDTFV